ncbi:hypothetical protein CJ030_MR2G018630 [Morella rubra]|uniref:Uncharacterized protein n=1 Tax=Morella rubra TaxID=262757 RepID=A0A6A1WC48_9ROSI|nr:hypothetical protein CJ030_MR2G018630 [Morella rubra]
MGSLSTELEAIVPEVADDECVAMVKNDSDSADDGIDDTQDCHSSGTEMIPSFINREIEKFQRWPLCDDILGRTGYSCGLSCLSGKNTLDDEELKGYQEFCSKERIVFSCDFSRLFLDERLLSEELIPTTYQDAIADDGTANLILDARILAIKEVMRQTELKLGLVSTYDYRSIMVHLLKSFMQAQLEDIFDKDAKEKSEAATEALLEELALDSQTDMDRGCGNVGKSKFKKKKKNRQKAKNIKETSGSTEHLPFYEDKAEQTHEESYQLPEIDHIDRVSTTDELEQPQEELSLEERMLAEALECQRKFENEAQLKVDHAEENKKTGEAIGRGCKRDQCACRILKKRGSIPLMGEAIDLAKENKKMVAVGEDVKDQISTVPDVYSENEEAGNGSSEQRLLEQFVSSSSIIVGSMPLMMMGYPKSFWSYVKAANRNVDEEDADDGEDTEQNSHFDVPSSLHLPHRLAALH